MSNISIKGLVKSYAGNLVIDNLDLEIHSGEFLTLLGPSGCGKTTTLRTIAGLEDPDRGEIAIGDKVVASTSRGVSLPPNKRSLGMVFQSYAIWPHMSVFNNVAYPLRRQGVPQSDIKKRVMATLESVGLAYAATRLSTQLSGGQQQRVALARAIVADPAVLLFDEPLSNLDAQLRLTMRDEIMRLRGEGRTSVYVTHDQSEAFALSDRIAVMFDGRIVQLDTAQEIVERPVNLSVARFLGIENLLVGTVKSRSGASVAVELDDVPGILEVEKPADGIGTGDKVTLAIRAPHVELVDEHATGNVCPGTIDQVTFLGDGFQYRVGMGASSVLAHQSLGDGPQRSSGDAVFVRMPARRLSLFPQVASFTQTGTMSVH